MKKIFLLTVIVMSMISLTSCEKETLLSENDIPSEVKTYVEKHFSGCTIFKLLRIKMVLN